MYRAEDEAVWSPPFLTARHEADGASLIALTVITGCGGEQEQQTAETGALDTAATAAPATGPGAAPAAVTDPQIADIVVAANEVDITAGELAQSKSANAQVKEFAQRMIMDDTGVKKATYHLVGRRGVTPEPNPTSHQLREGGERSRSRLQGSSGAEFDWAYIGREVDYHQQVLDDIDNTLIPNAGNAELKALLQRARPAV